MGNFNKELETQVQLFTQTGIELKHLSTHCQFHTFPVYDHLMRNLATKCKVDWIRNYKFTKVVLQYVHINKSEAANTSVNIKYFDYLVPIKY